MHRHLGVCALVLALAGAMVVTGCEDNQDLPSGPGAEPISLTEIILTPKSPAPGDTIALTAIITSSGENVGDFPEVVWSASDGVFLENNQLSVRWVAPSVSALYDISCRATNSVNSVSASTKVFVGSPITLIASGAGELHLTGTGNDFYYMTTPEINDGTTVARFVGGTISEAAPGARSGENRVFSNDLTLSASSAFTIQSGRTDQEQNVYLVDIGAGTETKLTADGAAIGAGRRYQYDDPYFAPNAPLIAYGGLRPSPILNVGVDTFDVFVYDVNQQTRQIPTETHGDRRRNMFPTFSSDGNWLVFVSDRTGVSQWELYGLPVNGGIVTTDSASTVRLSFTGGLITVGAPQVLPKPSMKWSPAAAAPNLAVLGADDILRVLTMNSSGATQTNVTGLQGRARQFSWSPDGLTLAVSDFAKLYVAPIPGGAATEIHTAVEGDAIRDMTWSPDGQWIAYRVLRGGIGWFELVDVDGSQVAEAAVLTASTSSNNVTNYARKMDMGPVFSPANELYLLEFLPGAVLTPRVTLLDISGIIQ